MSNGLLFIGDIVREQVCALRKHIRLLREALLTAEAFRNTLDISENSSHEKSYHRSFILPPAVCEYESRVHNLSLWADVCTTPQLLPIYDFTIGSLLYSL